MAAKKSKSGKTGAKKAAAKKGGAKKTAKKAVKKAPKKASGMKRTPAKKASAAKKAAPVKLNNLQRDLLKKVKDSGNVGYPAFEKTEMRTIEALQNRKLLKRGARNKATGKHHYVVTKSGEKQLTARI